jgi:GLPGLI family protein
MLKEMTSIILIFISVITYSQQKIKTDFEYKVVYNLTYSLDSTDLDNKKSEDMVLFLGDGISSYSSKAKLIGNAVVIKGNIGHTAPAALTDFQYIILKDLKNNTLAYTLQIVLDNFYYEQELDLFDWKLQEEIKTINGYEAQKATTTYSGRDYTAWFSSEIPISDGPFKFNGLPGLILEISDSENHYSFKIKSFEKLKQKIPFKTNLKQYIKTNKKDLFEVWYRYRKDPFIYVDIPDVEITVTPEVHEFYKKQFSEILAKENNRIEKN